MSEGIYRVVLLVCGAFLILFSVYFIYSGIGFILSHQTWM
jgi:hypothetical protein